jgi:hypothetical protein
VELRKTIVALDVKPVMVDVMMAVVVAKIMESVLMINNVEVNMAIVTFRMLIVDQNVKVNLGYATALTINVANNMVDVKVINSAVNGVIVVHPVTIVEMDVNQSMVYTNKNLISLINKFLNLYLLKFYKNDILYKK